MSKHEPELGGSNTFTGDILLDEVRPQYLIRNPNEAVPKPNRLSTERARTHTLMFY